MDALTETELDYVIAAAFGADVWARSSNSVRDDHRAEALRGFRTANATGPNLTVDQLDQVLDVMFGEIWCRARPNRRAEVAADVRAALDAIIEARKAAA